MSTRLLWSVERSRGGTGDHWLHLTVERDGCRAGTGSSSLSSPEEETPRGLCMSALNLASGFLETKAECALLKHSVQFSKDTCKHWWLLCDETHVTFCGHCDSIKQDPPLPASPTE